MGTPGFILSLREKIGHDLLWLPGVCVVVTDPAGRVLLGRRADNGLWAVVSGIPEPGEEPAAAARRELLEETGLDVEPLALVAVHASAPMTFPNGDRCAFMDHVLVARATAEQAALAHVADDESTDVGWFHPDALPEPLAASTPARVEAALTWLADPTTPARLTH